MSANIIVFDSGYIADQINKYYERSRQSLDGALKELEKANAHEGWKCNEHSKINRDINEIERGVERIERGMEDLIAVLWGAQQRYKDLETHAEGRINSLSETFKHGYVSGDILLPVTQVPDKSDERVHFISKDIRKGIIELAGVLGAVFGATIGLVGGSLIGLYKDIVEMVYKTISPEAATKLTVQAVPGLAGAAVDLGEAGIEAAKVIEYCINNENFDPKVALELVSSSTEASASAIWKAAAVGLAIPCPPAAAFCELMGIVGIDKTFLDAGAGIVKGAETGAAIAKNLTAHLLTMLDGEIEGVMSEDYPVQDLNAVIANFGLPVSGQPAWA